MIKRSRHRYSQRAGALALAAAFASSAFVAIAQAPASATVPYLGMIGTSLHIEVTGAEDVTVSCNANNVRVQTTSGGTVSVGGTTCATLTGLTVIATGSAINVVNLSGMASASFTAITSNLAFPSPRIALSAAWPIYVDLGPGDDTFVGSPLSDMVRGGTGVDTINTGLGNDVVGQGLDEGLGETPDAGAGTDTVVAYGGFGAWPDSTSVSSPSPSSARLTFGGSVGSTVSNAENVLITGGAFYTGETSGVTDYGQLFQVFDGSDTLTADSTVTMPTTIIGGGGNDALQLPFNGANTPVAICSPLHGSYAAAGRDTVTVTTASGYPLAIDMVSDPLLASDPLAKIGKMTRTSQADGFVRDCAVRTSGAAPQIAGGQFHPLVPYRIYDTRAGSGYQSAGVQIQPDWHNYVQVGGTSGSGNSVPNDGSVAAVVLNVVGLGSSSATFLKVFPSIYPSGVSSPPDASSLNLNAGEVRANNVTVALGAYGYIELTPLVAMDAIIDVLGYYTNSNLALEPIGHFESIAPERVFDTRPESDYADFTGISRPTNAGETFNVDIADNSIAIDSSFLGDDISAVVLNLTAIGLSESSYVTVWPAGAAMPSSSNVNVEVNGVNPNLVVVPVGVNGDISVFTLKSMHLVADVLGYFTLSGTYTSGRFQQTQPTRVFDSRDSNTQLTSANPFAVQIDGQTARGFAVIPVGLASAVVMNVTAVPTASGYVSVFPGDLVTTPPFPPGSNLNTVAGKPVPNAVWSEISSTMRTETNWWGANRFITGQIGVFFQTSGYAIVDVNGYFTAA